MTNDELRTLAAIAVPQRIQAMAHELTTYYREWPHLFHTPPQLSAGLLNGHKPAAAAPATTDAAPVRRRRKMSRKARMAISAAQKARWAKQRTTKKRAAAHA